MIKLTTVKIKTSDEVRGKLAAKGVGAEQLQTPHVVITEPAVHDKIHGLIEDALMGIMEQKAQFAEANGGDYEAVMAAQLNNVRSFNLDAGSGYTAQRKVELLESVDGLVSSDFEKSSKTTGPAKKDEIAGSLEL